MKKPHTAVILFGFVLMACVAACNRVSVCYNPQTGQYESISFRGSREFELAQHNPNCTK